MIEQFVHTIEDLNSINKRNRTMVAERHERFLNAMQPHVFGNVLEADRRNPFTDKVEQRFGVSVDNAGGDYNYLLRAPRKDYDTVISGHVLEHLYNPGIYLADIRDHMKPGGKLLIVFPQRPKFLWTNHHYHEVDDYRFRLMASDTGFTVSHYEQWHLRKSKSEHLTGIRTALRFFVDKEGFYLLIKR